MLKGTVDIIKSYNNFLRNNNKAKFILDVCKFFDLNKNNILNSNDLNLLLLLANKSGIPQYYDILQQFVHNIEISDENINLLTLSSIIHDSSLYFNGVKLHKFQKEIIEKFNLNEKNRYFLTASTSFGKTFVVYEIIKKMNYKNIILIFPSISLLTENYKKVIEDAFFSNYTIHTLSEEQNKEFLSENNHVYLFTPERYLSYLDNNVVKKFDFGFIDEIYKIDNDFIVDNETTGENVRDISYRIALENLCKSSFDLLLAGPYIEFMANSFTNFLFDNNIELLQYNEYEIVNKENYEIKYKQEYDIGNKCIIFNYKGKTQRLFDLISFLSTDKENTIIYCSTRKDAEKYANQLLESPKCFLKYEEGNDRVFNIFIKHLESHFGSNWVVVRAMKYRIGIHHALIPKYIQKEILDLFDKGILLCLFSTTTITEGVNTSAKNIIITSSKKGKKVLKRIDAKNIEGRAGRFMHHYSGRIIDLNSGFTDIIDKDKQVLNHKNYDNSVNKGNIDLQITNEKYLTEADKRERASINNRISLLKIPIDIFNCFKIIDPNDKISLYCKILKSFNIIKNDMGKLVICLNSTKSQKFQWKPFQNVINIIQPYIKEKKLKDLIETKVGGNNEYSLLTVLLYNYLSNGYMGMLYYYVNRENNPVRIDKAIVMVSDYVYRVFKYTLVKYLGIFDIFYRYIYSIKNSINFEDAKGIGLLLQRLEYNAISNLGRKLSDFGVPFKIVDYYDNDYKNDNKNARDFDEYENAINERIQNLVEKEGN